MVTSSRQVRPGLKPYATSLVVGDGDAAYDTAAEVGAIVQANTGNAAFTLIWQMTIPAQQIIGWGSGTMAQGGRNQGFVSFAAQDVGTDFEDGILRLQVANARQTRSQMVQEFNTQRLHTQTATTVATATPTDINQMVALPLLNAPKGGQDDLLQLWFRTTIPGTTVDSVTFSIPATIWQ